MLKNSNMTLLQLIDPKDIKRPAQFTDLVAYALQLLKEMLLLLIKMLR